MKTLFILAALVLLGFSAQAQTKPANPIQKHAVPKLFRVVSAPVVHPKRTGKQILGSILFTAESGADVAHVTFGTLDKVFSEEFKPYDPIHYLAVGSAKVDDGLEHAEEVLFGTHN